MKKIRFQIILALSAIIFYSFQAKAQIQFKIDGITKWEVTQKSLVPYSSSNSIFIGENAGQNDDNSVKYSLGIGKNALQSNAISFYNTAIGYEALKNNGIGASSAINDGSYNVAMGYRAGSSNTIGDKNTFIGSLAGYSNTTGRLNVALGFASLYDNTTGSFNVAIGSAMQYNTTGNNNVGIGWYALNSNTNGYSNTSVGSNSLRNATTAINNTAIGAYSSDDISTGSNNSAIGYWTMDGMTTGQENTAIGSFSGGTQNASYNTAVGFRALDLATSGHDNVAVGNWALRHNTGGNNNVAIGSDALKYNSVSSGLVAIGYEALSSYNGVAQNNNHIAIGSGASKEVVSAYRTLAIGNTALELSNEDDNMAIGHYAMATHNDGESNIAIGTNSLRYVSSNGGRTAIGQDAGWFDAGNYLTSVCVGYKSSNTASYQVRLGNSSTQNIGGYAPWSNLSDGRFKKNVAENVVGLDFINKLRPVTYNLDQQGIEDFLPGFRNSDGSYARYKGWYGNQEIKMSGFVAQEVEVAAAAVNYDFYGIAKPESENDHYSLRYAIFTVPLVKAVQELSKENETLKEKFNNRTKELKDLFNEVKALQEQFAQLEFSLKGS